MKEAKIAILGKGKTFGDVDAYKNRKYMYTVRSCSRHVTLYKIDARSFVMHLKSENKDS